MSTYSVDELPAARVIDGKLLSQIVLGDIRTRIEQIKAERNKVPGLGVILVGDDPASHTYVANKERTARQCGFETFDFRLPASASSEDVAKAIDTFNDQPSVHGILLQLPLPKHLDANKLLDRIRPEKDADGLHPVNQGLLVRGEGVLRSCTPLGVMKLIDFALSPEGATAAEIVPHDLTGKRAIVVGRSILVGKPVALMLLERNATVTMAHSRTSDLEARCREADIVVAAVGKLHLVKGDWIKPGAIVIDVGTNRTPEGKLRGDVDFESARMRAGAITPVPGGVGPMTIAMLLQNTFRSFECALRAEERAK